MGVARIEGTVKDQNGDVVPGARVTVVTERGKKLKGKTDKYGRFNLTSFALEAGKNKLTVEFLGFHAFRDEFSIRRNESINFPIVLEVGFVGVVVVRPEPLIDPKKSSTSTTIRIDN